jgi:shikimate dehydrogenase
MKQFAVIGHPIGHSLSPLMHNTAFKILGLDCNYEALDIEPASLKTAVEGFRKSTWGGLNVTIPHKESIIPYLDEVVSEAREIGAVNTVVNRNRSLIGYNTDVIGVEKSLGTFRTRIDNQLCAIIGSGGAARSVAYVLTGKFKPRAITIIALYPEQAKLLADSLGRNEIQIDIIQSADPGVEKAIRNSSLIVNATFVGMFPKVQEMPISGINWLSNQHTAFDVIYHPLKTRLLTEAQAAGAGIIDGLGMFINQGAAAFRIWTGKEMPISEIRKVLEEKLNAKNK